MREAGRICTAAMNRAIAKMKPGVPQYHVIAEIYHAQTMGVPGSGGRLCRDLPADAGRRRHQHAASHLDR